MTTSYDWWMRALELVGDYGVLTREHCAVLGLHENEPQPGFWRVPPPKRALTEQQREIEEAFVAIWPDAQGMAALWNGEAIDAEAAWTWCCRYPIEEERYRAAEQIGFTSQRLGIFNSVPQSGELVTGFQSR